MGVMSFTAAMDARLEGVATPERSAADADADAEVEQAEHHHGNDEEDESRHLVERPLGRSVLIEHGAKGRFRNQMATSAGVVNVGVDDARVDGERQGTDHGHQPDHGDDATSPLHARHCVSVQRVTNGQVTLQ